MHHWKIMIVLDNTNRSFLKWLICKEAIWKANSQEILVHYKDLKRNRLKSFQLKHIPGEKSSNLKSSLIYYQLSVGVIGKRDKNKIKFIPTIPTKASDLQGIRRGS